MKQNISQPYQFLMIALGGYLIYKIVGFISSIILYGLLLILTAVSFYPVEISLAFYILYHLLLLLFIIFVLNRISKNTLKIPETVFDFRYHRKVAIGYGVFYLGNAIVLYFSKGVYEKALVEFTGFENSFDSIGDKLAYFTMIESIAELILRLLFIVIYVVLIRKVGNRIE